MARRARFRLPNPTFVSSLDWLVPRDAKSMLLFALAAFTLFYIVVVLSVVLFLPTFEALFGVVMGVTGAGLVASLAHPDPIEKAGQRTAWVIAGPIYLGGLLSTVALLHQRPDGGSWVVLAMLFAFLIDTTAYFAGSLLGRHKLYPKVSPKKTVEGAIGGLLGAVGGASLVVAGASADSAGFCPPHAASASAAVTSAAARAALPFETVREKDRKIMASEST